MRALGIDETYITGDASDKEKFLKWAEVVPQTARNPLFHWTHLELNRYFGIDDLLTPESAGSIYKKCNSKLSQESFSAQGLLQKMNVEVVCTTDDPGDNLLHHKEHFKEDTGVSMHPTFRPDPVYNFSDPKIWNSYINRLEESADTEISNLNQLFDLLEKRIDYFQDAGCKLADHGLGKLPDKPTKPVDENQLFKKIRDGYSLTLEEQDALAFRLLVFLGKNYHKRGWTQQFHLGAFRNTSSRLFNKLGPNTGFDSIGDYPQGVSMKEFFDELDRTNQLTKTIIYNLNPADNALFATMAGNYNDGSIKGKMQYGPAWWFLDQKDGIEDQLNILSNLGLLSTFTGMLTDSRSFLSYTRHEYFRRILCNLIGRDVESGELPNDPDWLGGMITDICYNNAKQYFNF
jgi:glucuronate isomerase